MAIGGLRKRQEDRDQIRMKSEEIVKRGFALLYKVVTLNFSCTLRHGRSARHAGRAGSTLFCRLEARSGARKLAAQREQRWKELYARNFYTVFLTFHLREMFSLAQ